MPQLSPEIRHRLEHNRRTAEALTRGKKSHVYTLMTNLHDHLFIIEKAFPNYAPFVRSVGARFYKDESGYCSLPMYEYAVSIERRLKAFYAKQGVREL